MTLVYGRKTHFAGGDHPQKQLYLNGSSVALLGKGSKGATLLYTMDPEKSFYFS